MNPGPAISADASQPLGSRRRAGTVSATTRGGFPACRASTSATLVARSPNFRSAGTSTVKGGGRSTGSSPAVIASISAWRRSASRCRFIPVRTAPKPVAGLRREQGPGRDHDGRLYRLRNGPVKRIRGPGRCSRAARRRRFLRAIAAGSLLRGRRLLRLRTLALDQLDDGQVRGVAEAVAELHHARVTTVTLGVARRDLVEEFLHDARAPQHRRGTAP